MALAARLVSRSRQLYSVQSAFVNGGATQVRSFAKEAAPADRPPVSGDDLLKGIFFEVKKKFETALSVLKKEKITIDPDDPAAVSRYAQVMKTVREKADLLSDSQRIKYTIGTFTKGGVTSQPHQLQQCAPVSGTAKGKSKLKAGQPLKRSSIGKKGIPSAGGGGGGRGRREAMERITQISESCLNAPTPLRHLSPKERLREAKREELGLISKERQRELDIAKAKAKSKSKGTGGDDGGRVLMGPPGLDYISLGLVDEEEIPKYELTVEDGRRLAKEYSRVLMRRHRARQTAESTLLKLKKEAIAALPEKLRAAAMVPDMTPFPANRYMATLTPPIEGYIEKVRDAAKKHSVKEKLR